MRGGYRSEQHRARGTRVFDPFEVDFEPRTCFRGAALGRRDFLPALETWGALPDQRPRSRVKARNTSFAGGGARNLKVGGVKLLAKRSPNVQVKFPRKLLHKRFTITSMIPSCSNFGCSKYINQRRLIDRFSERREERLATPSFVGGGARNLLVRGGARNLEVGGVELFAEVAERAREVLLEFLPALQGQRHVLTGHTTSVIVSYSEL